MTFFAKATEKSGEIFIYEDIGDGGWFGGISSKMFSEEMKKVENVSDLNIYINSPGGSVFEGISIYNQIIRHKAKVKTTHIDGLAASIASIIALAGDKVKMASNGRFMIHDPWTMSVGTAEDLRKAAGIMDGLRDTLLNTYVDRTGGKKEEISKMMSDETWMDAEMAKKYKFIDEVVESQKVQNAFPLLARFKAVPKDLEEKAKDTRTLLAHMDMRVQRINRARSIAA